MNLGKDPTAKAFPKKIEKSYKIHLNNNQRWMEENLMHLTVIYVRSGPRSKLPQHYTHAVHRPITFVGLLKIGLNVAYMSLNKE